MPAERARPISDIDLRPVLYRLLAVPPPRLVLRRVPPRDAEHDTVAVPRERLSGRRLVLPRLVPGAAHDDVPAHRARHPVDVQ